MGKENWLCLLNMPEFHIYPREGTYLLWMDYSKLSCTEEELEEWFLKKAKVSVYMADGTCI